ncbi:hypothetical protein Droror1_Dr00018771 [Drosera rotundifolia]
MRRSNARKSRHESANENPNSMDSIKSLNLKQSTLFRTNSLSKTSKNTSKSNLVVVSALSVSFAVAIWVLMVFFGRRSGQSSSRFGIVIDGGSTGSRIHVFEYRVEGGLPVFDFGPDGLGSMRVNPGLSAYAGDPGRAGGSLVELLEFGKRRVPREFWGETEIRLMATAGLRLLEVKDQERIIESCRRALRSSGFKFQDDWASVISGSDEGLYAWVVANYALGSLGGDPQQTSGIIELGGASAQVTYASSGPVPAEFSHSLKFGNVTYNLYSHSWLHFGQNAAFDSLRELLVSNSQFNASSLSAATGAPEKKLLMDPCTPKGYSHHTTLKTLSPDSVALKYESSFRAVGNFSQCKTAALMVLQGRKEDCASHTCTSESFSMPKLHGNFLATENFFYTSKFFGLAPEAALSDLMHSGQRFCEEEWSNIKPKYSSMDEEDLSRYCFSSAYIVALLHDGLGVGLDEARVRYTNQVEGIPLDWALGAFILHSVAEAQVECLDQVTGVAGNGLSSIFLLLIAFLILVIIGWSISNWRKPHLKTIYDLEKGRYIVTRISR